MSERFSSTRNWRVSIIALVAVTTILIPIAFHRVIRDEFEKQAVRRYTFHPSAPTTYDGLLFPAGSTVIEDPDTPHSVTRGNVPENTALLGLVISGDFIMSQSTAARELIDSTLAKPGKIHDVPCASGPFKIERDITPKLDVSHLNCSLATDYTVNGITLKADTGIEVALDHSSIRGTLAAPWKSPTADCAPGDFFSDPTLLECTLLHDMTISGYPLAAGHEASIVTSGNGVRTLYRGTLSHSFRVLGVDIPAGSEISSSGEVPSAEKLINHELDTYESVDFHLPESAHLVIDGADIRGRVRMNFEAHTFGVNDDALGSDDHVAGLHHDGISGEHGTYNPETKKWCWEQACWQ
jgi:hypothetical protein